MTNEYLPLQIKAAKYGIRAGAKADALIEYIKANTNEKGYFNFSIHERKEIGKYGETHYAKLDTWTPEKKNENNSIPF